jgi:uncharacterized protein DUF1206
VATPRTSSGVELSVRRSELLAWAVRTGLVGYGLLHLLVAWVAVRLVLTPAGGTVTGRGALAQLAQDTSGRIALAVMAAGFAALVLWQLIAAAVGWHDQRGVRRTVERLGALCRATTWGYLAYVTAELTVEGGSGGGSPSRTTASVMSWPAGTWVVALVGGVVVAVGVGLAVFGWREGFVDQIDEQARSRDGRRVPIVVLGKVGYVAKGSAAVVIGVLLVWAAWTRDPHKSGGLDAALHELLGGGPGKVAIIVVALGLACFGLFLFARARHLARASLTS